MTAALSALHGRTCVVTGAGAGIGRDIALSLAAAGANCVLVGRSAPPLAALAAEITGTGGQALACTADVAQEAEVDTVFAQAQARFGAVHALVNNAGVAGPIAPIGSIALEGWLATLATNLTGPWLCSRAAARAFATRPDGEPPAGSPDGPRGGAIVNIGSISGKRPLANRTPYCASKMGLLGLTRALALELGPANVNVNCISPGAVRTKRLELLAEQAKMPLADFLKAASSMSALQRITEGADIAAMCVFLLSDAARNITGQDFTIDAGTYMD